MRPLEFYRLGIDSAVSAVSEPLQRTVVNRLYYGLHHEACCRYFRENPWAQPINTRGRHIELRNRFAQSNDPSSRRVGDLLNDLIRLRTEADYQLVPPLRFRNQSLNAQQLMSLAIEISGQLFDALESYSPGEAPDGCECRTAYSSS